MKRLGKRSVTFSFAKNLNIVNFHYYHEFLQANYDKIIRPPSDKICNSEVLLQTPHPDTPIFNQFFFSKYVLQVYNTCLNLTPCTWKCWIFVISKSVKNRIRKKTLVIGVEKLPCLCRLLFEEILSQLLDFPLQPDVLAATVFLFLLQLEDPQLQHVVVCFQLKIVR
jgi:hypothetical protein